MLAASSFLDNRNRRIGMVAALGAAVTQLTGSRRTGVAGL